MYSKEDIKLVSYDFDPSLAKLPVVRVASPGNIAINTLTMNTLKERWDWPTLNCLVENCIFLKVAWPQEDFGWVEETNSREDIRDRKHPERFIRLRWKAKVEMVWVSYNYCSICCSHSNTYIRIYTCVMCTCRQNICVPRFLKFIPSRWFP